MRIKKTSQYIEGGAGLPSYFTDEIDTGMKWIDGKPIYRKVIIENYTTTGEKQISISDLNYDFIMLKNWNVVAGDNQNYVLDTFNGNQVNSWIDNVAKKLILANSSSWAKIKYTAILEYTKTTD